MLIKNKSGKGHVEAILSFTIFTGFLIFVFTLFNPFTSSLDSGLVENAFNNFNNELSVKASSVSISLNHTPQNCFILSDFQEILQDLDCNAPNNIAVKNQNKNLINHESDVGLTYLSVENSLNSRFYSIACSDEISVTPQTVSSCDNLVEHENYTIGLILEKDVWSESKVSTFETDYSNNYQSLKEKIVPSGNEFDFTIWDVITNTPLYQGTKEPPRGVRIDARTIPSEIMYANGSIERRTITIRIW